MIGIDYLAELGHIEILVLLGHIAAGDDRRDRRRVGTGTSDAQFLHAFLPGRPLCNGPAAG